MKNKAIFKTILLTSILGITILFFSNFHVVNKPAIIDIHEYAEITEERIDAALAEGATEYDLLLAEGSLMGLGWLVALGNDDYSFNMAKKYSEKVFDTYNGTAMIHIYSKNVGYSEILNLRRFEKESPEMVSIEYYDIAFDRLKTAFDNENAGYAEFKLAEGSLMALGWMTLYGNGTESMTFADQLMNLAYKTFPNSDGYYMKQSSEGYAEIINLGRFAMDKPEAEQTIDRFTNQEDGTVLDNTTGLVWIKEPVDIEAMNWEDAMTYVATLCVDDGGLGLTDGSKAGDWRMPTNEEWQTMKGWLNESSGMDLFRISDEGRYWSSTTPVNEYGAYHVNALNIGKADFDSRNRKLNIWPVRNK